MNWTNIIVGLLQVLIPAGLAFAEQQGWIPSGTLTNTIIALTTAGSAAHSASTTVTPAVQAAVRAVMGTKPGP